MPDDQQMLEQQMIDPQAEQQNFVPDDGQIGVNAQNMTATVANPELDGFQGMSEQENGQY